MHQFFSGFPTELNGIGIHLCIDLDGKIEHLGRKSVWRRTVYYGKGIFSELRSRKLVAKGIIEPSNQKQCLIM